MDGLTLTLNLDTARIVPALCPACRERVIVHLADSYAGPIPRAAVIALLAAQLGG